mgnify:CR=1 FL=1
MWVFWLLGQDKGIPVILILLAVVVLAFVILVNLVVQALPSKWTEFDISTSSLFTLSDTSKNLLHELNSDVTAYYLAESGQEDANITRADTERAV